MKDQTGIFDGLMGCWPESSDSSLSLDKIREVLHQGLYAGWTEENQKIIVGDVDVGKIAGKRPVNNGFLILNLVVFQHFRNLLLVYVRAGEQKLFSFMFFNQLNEIGITFLTMKDFTFSELNIFLQVIGSGFRDAEVLHGLRDLYPHLFAHSEIVVNCISRSEDDSRIVKNVYFILAKVFCRYPVNLEKFAESYVDIEFSCNLTIR